MKRSKVLFVSVLALLLVVAAMAPTAQAAPPGEPSIVDVAVAVNQDSGEFSTLIAALQAAGLVEALDGNKHYTVFAPTDAAFAQLGLNAGNVGSLPTETLTDIQLYHVTRGDRFSQSVLPVRQIRMLNGDFTHPSRDGTINGATIVAADIDAGNGVIHVIDAVLLPPAD